MFRLRDGVSFCETGGEFIFLDIESDRYVALEPLERASFARLLADRLAPGDPQSLAGLVRAGLLSRCLHDAPIAPCQARPATSAVGQSSEVRARDVGHAALRLAASTASVRTRPLRRVLSRLAARKERTAFATGAEEQALARIAGAFATTALLAAPVDRCLPRALALAHAMIDRSLRPELVIGVRLRPFGAHSWVQHGGMLMTDTIDHAREFTPILVI